MPVVIRKFLDLSTGHLKPEDIQALDLSADPRSIAGPSCSKTQYGWFVWCPDEMELYGPEEIPDNLRAILVYARQRGCDYVLFDRDAEVNDDLQIHDPELAEAMA